ncbi:hypothetical protein EDD16DRAFT_1519747 [Pisolithus croceorrhizus]|nr:hypothetical protein EDD16DRAFT_1519747 [Pisolithus croceorrhizus]
MSSLQNVEHYHGREDTMLVVNLFPRTCDPSMGCLKRRKANPTSTFAVNGFGVGSGYIGIIYIDITERPTWVTSAGSDIPKLQHRRQADTEHLNFIDIGCTMFTSTYVIVFESTPVTREY